MQIWQAQIIVQDLISRNEVAAFEKWLEGSSRKKETHSWKILQILVENPLENWKDREEEFWQRMEIKSTFKEATLRKYRSQFKDKYFDYLKWSALTKNADIGDALLAQELQERDQYRLLESFYNKKRREFEAAPIANLDTIYAQISIQEAKMSMDAKLDKTLKTTNLPRLFKLHDRYWQISHLRLGLIGKAQGEIHAFSEELSFFTELIKHLKSKPPSEKDLLLNAYYQVYLLFSGEKHAVDLDPIHYNPSIQEGLDEGIWELFALMANYMIKMRNEGEGTSWDTRLLELYNWGVRIGLLFEGEHMDPKHYKNFVQLSLSQGNIQDARSAMEEWRKYLPPNLAENYYKFCKASCLFAEKKFDEMVDTWGAWPDFDKNISLTLPAQYICLKALFEQYYPNAHHKDQDYFKSRLRSLLRWVEASAMGESRKKNYIGRLRGLEYLRRAMPYTPVALERLKHQLSNTRYLGDKRWYMEQYERLKKQAA